MDPTYYIDIKSEGLRDILRLVLRDIRTVNLNEDKPACIALPPAYELEPSADWSLGRTNLLYNYLHQLESIISGQRKYWHYT